ncbi:hypothetical protein GJAV_G00198270 [Gymnothorax javanicus]|nr:hypothetical protein GJAV_G00198270 [Gymnothorax javanicus]
MASKTAKLAALPAALGFATVRVYALSESKAEDLRSPHELSVYTAPTSPSRYVEENPGLLQRGLGVVRVGLLPYVRAIKNACVSVKIGSVNLYHAGEDAYDFLRDPPPGFLPRISFITVCGLAGLVLARKGTRLKRVGVSLGLATVGAGVCYPVQTVAALKVSGKQAYKATQWASSSVTSLWKPSPAKKVTAPSAGPEAVPVPGPDPAAPPVKPAPESEPAPPPAEDPAPSAVPEGASPVLPTDAGPAPSETPTEPASGRAAVPPPAESASLEEGAPLPAPEAPPGHVLDHSPDPAPPEPSVDPLSEQIAPAADALGILLLTPPPRSLLLKWQRSPDLLLTRSCWITDSPALKTLTCIARAAEWSTGRVGSAGASSLNKGAIQHSLGRAPRQIHSLSSRMWKHKQMLSGVRGQLRWWDCNGPPRPMVRRNASRPGGKQAGSSPLLV